VARPASREELRRFHRADYLDHIERGGQGEISPEALALGIGTVECPIFPGMYELCRLGTGASLAGLRALVAGEAQVAFNPLGGFHHAGPETAEGFCYVNDVVLACQELAEQGLKVACLDLDVHHGNGTEAAFLSDPRVLTISLHESGETLYPWAGFAQVIGEGPGRGYNINVPLPQGTDDDTYTRAFGAIVVPLLRAFEPDYLVLEIGMDILSGDPLAHFKMTNNGIADCLAMIREPRRPVLALGGGGYNPRSTARGWAVALLALCDAEPEDDYAGSVAGVFLGTTDRSGGMRDMRIYASGDERDRLAAAVDEVIAFHRATTFPLWGIQV
jgi:acetoin utilization protein AcuC